MNDEYECQGHESWDGPIGHVTYCDGSCKPHREPLDFDVVPAPTPQPTARDARRHPDAVDAERQNRRAMRQRKGRS
jgi:hypothetical protein